MQWHYVKDGQAAGPIEAQDMGRLEKEGQLKPETLVWTEGMSEWRPLDACRDQLPAPALAPLPLPLPLPAPVQAASAPILDLPQAEAIPAAAPPPEGKPCSLCGKAFRPDELFSYQGKSICPHCKPAFLAKLKAGQDPTQDFEFAGFWRRFGARFIDGLLSFFVNSSISGLFMLGFGKNGRPEPFLIFAPAIINLAIFVSYEVVLTSKKGGTLGKLAMGLRVVNEEGEYLDMQRSLYRWLATLLSSITLGIGYLIMLGSPKKQTLHDRLVGTFVIKA